jgi:hypothetical protein
MMTVKHLFYSFLRCHPRGTVVYYLLAQRIADLRQRERMFRIVQDPALDREEMDESAFGPPRFKAPGERGSAACPDNPPYGDGHGVPAQYRNLRRERTG